MKHALQDVVRRGAVVLYVAIIAALTAPAGAELALARVFTNHMVLQCERPIPVWGEAKPGVTVTINLAGRRQSTTADAKGQWRVDLPARAASDKPLTLKVTAGQTVTITDVVVGEVWLCAGQSNMEWPVKRTTQGKGALAVAGDTELRLLNVVGAARGGSGVYTPTMIERMAADRFSRGNWQRDSAEAAAPFSGVGYYFGKHLRKELKVPVGMINVSIGGTPTEAWISREALAGHPRLQVMVQGNWLDNAHLGQWCQGRARSNLSRALKEGDDIPGDDIGPNHSFKPAFMWDASVKPLTRIPVRGVLWYQGESNGQTIERTMQHSQVFALLISDWRKQFNQPDLPVGFVQLPALGRPHWPAFREGQRRIHQQTPHTGMAVTMDVGHPTNVHPTNKQPVGDRLALSALAKVYGRKANYASPMLGNVQLGKRVKLDFNHAANGLQTSDGQPPRGFEISGLDGVFHPAAAKITAPRQVTLTCDEVAEAFDVRYGWAPYPNPALNLVNSDGLPACPFTTQEHYQ